MGFDLFGEGLPEVVMLEARSGEQNREKEVFLTTELSGPGLGGGEGMEAGRERIGWVDGVDVAGEKA